MEWYGYANMIAKRNELMNRKCGEITKLLAQDGYRSVVIKGQANATIYPYPEYRTSGDIDIWIDGKRKQIIYYLLKHAEVKHIQFHYADYNILSDVEIEAHFIPSMLYNFFDNNRLQDIFEQERNNSMENIVTLQDGSKIGVLTPRANVMMQLAHMYGHFLFEGIGLRQPVDFYLLLKKQNSQSMKKTIN